VDVLPLLQMILQEETDMEPAEGKERRDVAETFQEFWEKVTFLIVTVTFGAEELVSTATKVPVEF